LASPSRKRREPGDLTPAMHFAVTRANAPASSTFAGASPPRSPLLRLGRHGREPHLPCLGDGLLLVDFGGAFAFGRSARWTSTGRSLERSPTRSPAPRCATVQQVHYIKAQMTPSRSGMRSMLTHTPSWLGVLAQRRMCLSVRRQDGLTPRPSRISPA